MRYAILSLGLVVPLVLVACKKDDPGGWPDDDDVNDDDDLEDDDTGDDDDTAVPDPEWTCVDYVTMDIHPVPMGIADTMHLDITQESGGSGHVYVDLSGTDPGGSAVTAVLDDVVGSGPWTW